MSALNPIPTPAAATSAAASKAPNDNPAPAAADPGQSHAAEPGYRTLAGCLSLSLITLAAVAAIILFVALFGNFGP